MRPNLNLMESRLSAGFSRLEQHRKATQELMFGTSDMLLNRKPKAEAWSPIQIMHHLINAEKASCEYLRKKLPHKATEPTAGVKHLFAFALLQLSLRTTFIKFKAPEVTVREMPLNDVSLADTIARWDAVRADMRDILETIAREDIAKTLFRHPLAGKLTIPQMLAFMDTHQVRHFGQIRRILAQ